MPSYVAVDKKQHKDFSYTPFKEYFFAQDDTTTPLLAAELSHALPHYPLAFIKNNATNKFSFVTLNSLQANFNLFIAQNGAYLSPYVPSCYRAHPFSLLPNPEKNNELTLCFLEESPLIQSQNAPDSVPFFSQDEAPSKELSDIINFMQQRLNNETLTQALVDKLDALGLIVPWKLNLKTDNESEPKEVEGVFQVDEEALKSLEPQDLSELAKNGALALAYGQLLSQNRINNFTQLYAYHEKHAKKEPAVEDLDLDSFFAQNDTIKF